MNINFSNTKLSVNIEVPDVNSTELPTASFIAEAIKEDLTALIKQESYYRRFDTTYSSDMSDESNQNTFLKSLKSGMEEYRSYLAENPEYKDGSQNFIDGAFSSALESDGLFPDATYESLDAQFGCTLELAESLITYLEENSDNIYASGTSPEEILEALCNNAGDEDALSDTLKEFIENAMMDADTSTVNDLYSEIGDISMVFVPSSEKLWSEDSMMTIDSVAPNPEFIVPDEQFEDFIKMVNIMPIEFVSAVKEASQIDLLNENSSSRALEWQALCSKTSNELGIKTKRKSSLSGAEMLEIIENAASTYITPVMCVDIDAETVIKMATSENKELLITDGGQIGVHDFLNGSGHLETSAGTVVISANIDNWTTMNGSECFGYSDMDSVYGMTSSATKATVKLVDIKSPSKQLDMEAAGF